MTDAQASGVGAPFRLGVTYWCSGLPSGDAHHRAGIWGEPGTNETIAGAAAVDSANLIDTADSTAVREQRPHRRRVASASFRSRHRDQGGQLRDGEPVAPGRSTQHLRPARRVCNG
jgi:hypothetical protein